MIIPYANPKKDAAQGCFMVFEPVVCDWDDETEDSFGDRRVGLRRAWDGL